MPKGTVLFSSRAPIGYIAIADNDISTNQGFKSIVPFDMRCNEYIYYCLQARLNDIKHRASGTTFKEISGAEFGKTMIPFPPLAEQQRIVARIEELQPDIDAYDKAQTELRTIEQRFPDDMKKSLLQYAIEGKLVPQRKEEGTARDLLAEIRAEKEKLIKAKKIKKTKPLPEITDDEKPFEIPDSWEWVRLSDVIDVRDGTHNTPPYYKTGVPLVTSKNLSNGQLDFSDVKYISEDDAMEINKRSKVEKGDILFAMIGSIGNPVLVTEDRAFCIKNVALFKNFSTKINMKYIFWLLVFLQNEMKTIASGGVQSFISLKVFRNYIIPLPPIAEQHRIVARIEELLPFCRQLLGEPV